MTSLPVQLPAVEQWGVLLYLRTDVLFELTDALLCRTASARLRSGGR
ncbi:hypothetical protein [Kitasatospora sp. GP82]|nr:hypothetical protein [Kitasatospora sp. GP82]MDH6129937.1 hypothetical protein [Kitasatospora sp. GP82]